MTLILLSTSTRLVHSRLSSILLLNMDSQATQVLEAADSVQFTKSSKGKEMATYEGRLFYFHVANTDGSIKTWRCSKYRSIKCHGTLKTKHRIFHSSTSHTCDPDVFEVKKCEFMAQLRSSASTTSETTSKVVAKRLYDADSELKSHLPNVSSMKKSVQRSRRINKVNYKNPTTLIDLPEIPENYQVIKDKRFVLYDNGVDSGNDRILIFGTQDSCLYLDECVEIFCDGTFKCAPPLFYQLYVIVGLKNDHAFPCLYILLPGKSKQIYDQMLKEVRKLCQNLKPLHIMVDFEQASIASMHEAFKRAKLSGCYFHFKQAILRNLQTFGTLWHEYTHDMTFAANIRKLFGLCFVPENRVESYFENLMTTPFYINAYEEEVCYLLLIIAVVASSHYLIIML